MLAFDLETTNLNPMTDKVTCAGVYDPDAGIERVFFFQLGSDSDDPEDFMLLLDRADRLCAFNGARFDLPFIQHALGANPDRIASWRLKLHDVFEGCKLALGITFSLQALLELNGIQGKTGSGKEAILLAHEEQWEKLGKYCLQDTRITHQVSSLTRIFLPHTRGIYMDRHGRFCTLETE